MRLVGDQLRKSRLVDAKRIREISVEKAKETRKSQSKPQKQQSKAKFRETLVGASQACASGPQVSTWQW
jgi:hypothetical protein